MSDRRLTDADIEALIGGHAVDGAPPQLDDLVSALRLHADTEAPMSSALEALVVGGEASTAPTAESGLGTVLTLKRRRRSSLVKAASAVGVLPVSLLVGATMAAATLGGAHVVGFVDVPLLPDRSPGGDVVVPAVPATGPSQVNLTTPTVGLDSEPDDASHAATAQHPSTSAEIADDADDAEDRSGPSLDGTAQDRGRASTAVPEQAAVEGSPGCELGQNVANQQRPRSTRPASDERTVDPCAQATTPGSPSNPGQAGDDTAGSDTSGNDTAGDAASAPPGREAVGAPTADAPIDSAPPNSAPHAPPSDAGAPTNPGSPRTP